VNTPGNVTNGSTNSLTLNAARCVLLKFSVTNTSGAGRVYVLADASGTPAQSASGPTGVRSPVIPGGQTWTPTPVDSAEGVAFSLGCYFQSFAVDANNNPIWTALSAADANVIAGWSAALQ
jgi:hypothetical protein